MSSNPSTPYELSPQATMAAAKPEQRLAGMTFFRDAFDDPGKIRSTTSMLALALIATSLAASVGGALWAIQLGVSYPIAIMAGYCTFAVSACQHATRRRVPAPISIHCNHFSPGRCRRRSLPANPLHLGTPRC